MSILTNISGRLSVGLRFFGADGGEGAPGASGTSPAAEAIAKRAEAEAKKNPFANVKFGRQDDARAQSAEPDPDDNAAKEGGETPAEAKETPEQKAARFDALIKGEFKELYGKKVSNAVNDRLKGVSSKAEKFDQLEETLSLLSSKYNVDPTDVKALAEAIRNDDKMYEDEALEQGVPVERVKAEKLAQAENRRLNAQIDEMRKNEAAKELYQRWLTEAEETKKYYPSFDLDAEVQNPDFVSLIRNNVNVQKAYEVIHMGEFIPSVIQKAEQKEGERIAAKYATNARRVAENGSSSQGAAVVKSDPAALSKAEREEVVRRVARGEKISF